MKGKLFFAGAIATLVLTAFSALTPVELEIGATMPKGDLKMKDVSEKEITLNEKKDKNGLLVIFTCNTCPYVAMYQSRMQENILAATRSGFGVVLVNSNEAYRGNEDSFENMKKFAETNKYKVPYVVDAKSEVADAFGAMKTPHVFLFDKDGKLAYKGAIDDNAKDANAATQFYLRDALKSLATGKPVAVTSSKSIGCSIKRVEETH